MSFRRLTWIAALAFAALGHSAQAGTITQIDPYGPSSTPFSTLVTFNTFDTSLGTLTSVTVTVTETGTVTSSVTNIGTAASSFTNASSTGTVTVTGPDGTTTSTSLSTTPASGPIAGSSGSVLVGTTTGTASPATISVPTADFSSYETPPASLTYTITAAGTVTSTGTSPSGDVFFGGGATVSGNVEVVYNYTSTVPEPASFAMLALGMGGIFAVRRFFHQTRKTVS